MSQDATPPRGRNETLTPGDTQRLREIRERLKRLERELKSIPGRKRSTTSDTR
jgi:hypothetical protein